MFKIQSSQFASLKKGNLDVCFNCDELDEKKY